MCDPGLPNRALVTKVQFTVSDTSVNWDIRNCGLFRTGLTPSTAGTVQELALVSPTGLAATPGTVRKTDSSIKHAIVDNTSWAYELQCQIDYLFNPDLPPPSSSKTSGIFGADVIYSISSTNG